MSKNVRNLMASCVSRSYPIYISSGILDDTQLVRQHIKGKQVLIVTNETLAPLYLERCEPISNPPLSVILSLESCAPSSHTMLSYSQRIVSMNRNDLPSKVYLLYLEVPAILLPACVNLMVGDKQPR